MASKPISYRDRICGRPSNGDFGNMANDRGNNAMVERLLRRARICDLIAALFGLCVILPIFWMLFSRSPVIEVIETRVEPPIAQTGELIRTIWRAKELRRGCGGTVTPRFIDSTNRIVEFHPYSTFVYNTPGEVREFYRVIDVPRGLAPGLVQYVPIVKRWCNPLQEYFWNIDDFTVHMTFEVVDTVIRAPLKENP